MISIIIPAHNEAAVIHRTLTAMTQGALPGELDVIVVCNGCTDTTASIARSFGPPVRVIETDIASKAQALNLGDSASSAFPRIYVDADVLVGIDAIRKLSRRLEHGDVLVVAPTPIYDVRGCSILVRAFFKIRAYLPSAREGIGGSGVYALCEAGRTRFGRFPMITSDDGYVRIQFHHQQRETLLSASSTVFPPRTLKDLIAQKTRTHFGSFELQSLFPDLWRNRGESNNRSLISLFRRPQLWPSLAVYCFVMSVARHQARERLHNKSVVWERDETSRSLA
jgi:glycosyltransferase involved in cell wall biosynthesis